MAIPIKERGIRWVESYSGEKSAHLKKEMDSQIGPGAYCRWEGHDPTSGNDYYVVVSPGFSKKRGFHFFAGLRKMPADHGASGKKFASQREAMSHARDTWQVPPPKDKPPTPQGYTINEIRNAPVLMEIQHKGKGASANRVIKKATVLNSLGIGSPNIKRREGWRTTTEVLCYSYGAAPLIGMYPAIMTRPRFLAVDVVNVPEGRRVLNEFTGEIEAMGNDEGDLPPAPAYATYESPTQEDFEKVRDGGIWTENKLVSIGTKTVNKQKNKVVNRSRQYADAPDSNYNTITWRGIRLTPTLIFSKGTYHETAPLWRDLMITFGGWQPRERYWNPRDPKPKDKEGQLPDFEIMTRNYLDLIHEKNLDRVEIRVEMNPEIYDEVVKKISAPPFKGTVKVTNNIQKTLISAREIEKDNFDWDEVFFESIKLTGSRLLRYDDAGLPHSIVPMRQNYTEEEAEEEVGKQPKYLVRDPYDIISPYAFEDLGKLGMMHELLYLVNYKPKGWEKKVMTLASAMGSKAFADNAIKMSKTDDGLATVNSKAKARMDAFVQSITDRAWSGEAPEEKSLETLQYGIDDLVAARGAGDQAGMLAAHKPIKYYLMGFQWLAAEGKVGLSHEQFVHSHTAAPHLTDYKPVGNEAPYDLDEMRIPKGATEESDPEQEIKRAEGASYAPPFEVNFPTVDSGEGHVYAGCRYDSEKKTWVFGPLPENVSPEQRNLKGMHTIINGMQLVTIAKDGRPHVIKGGQSVRFRTAPREDGNDAIVGGCHDIIVAPEGASAKGSDEEMIQNAMSRLGFGIWTQHHAVFEPSISGIGRKSGNPLRQYKSNPLLKADPKNNPKLYQGQDEGVDAEGRPGTYNWDVSKDAFKTSKGVFFKDNVSAARMIAKVVRTSLKNLGPITPINVNDQRMIDAYQREAMEYANSIDLYRQEKSTNERNFFQGDRLLPRAEVEQALATSPLREPMLAAYDAVAEGERNEKSIDQARYEYGVNCRMCGKELNANAHVRKAFWEAVKEAIKDPEKAFERKSREIFCLSYVDVITDANGNQQQIEVDISDDKGDTVVFGSLRDAEFHLPAFQAIHENQDKQLYVRPMGMHVFPYAMSKNPTAQYDGLQQFKQHVQDKYRKKAPAKPVTPTTTTVPVTPTPGAPTPGAPTPPVTPAPPAPSGGLPPPPTPAPPTPPKGGLPPPPRTPAPPPSPITRTPSVIQRLVSLADKLDSSGKKGEADAVDRILRKTCQSQ